MANKIQKRYSVVNSKGQIEEKVETIGMYHNKDNHSSYDKSDVSDLTPYEFAKLLKY